MSDYERVYLFNVHVNTRVSLLVAFFSVVSAVRTASYFGARILPTVLVWVGVGLFGCAALPLVLAFALNAAVLLDIRTQMGATLAWHFAVRQSPLLLSALCAVVTWAMLAIFVGAVWFCFHFRHTLDASAAPRSLTPAAAPNEE